MHIEIGSMRQFQYVPTTYVTEIKQTYFEIYTQQESFPLAFLFYISQSANQYIQEVFHVNLNKFENAVTHLFLLILGNN